MDPQGHAALWLGEEWGRQVTRAMESMTGEPVPVTLAAHQLEAGEIDPSQQELLWWEQPLSLGPDANIWVAARGRTWEEIGYRVLRSAGVDGATREDLRGPYLEIINQSLSGLASAVSRRFGKEISCVPGRSAPPSALRTSAFAFQITLGEQAFPLLAAFAAPLANLSGSGGSIDMLLDVELPVIVSFGRAQLMLKDVIKLTTGSIVQLNRALSEPVEVIVNNCVIARGEVVVVEGNSGGSVSEL
jgi:flagellar motor switch protein FliN/FliY